MLEKDLLLKRFGKQIQIFRKQLLLSREDLGKKTGLTSEDIGDIEAGTGDPTLTIISLLAEALNISPAELLHLQSEYNSEYLAYRFYLLQILNSISTENLKKTIRNLESTTP